MTQRIETAIDDLRRYLRDEIPPSGAADALARLMAQPPEVLMQHVGTWSAEQSAAQSRPVADLLLHALKKVNAPAELGLLDREAMANYLDRISTIAIRLCPPEQRNQLRSSISAMRISHTTTSSGIIPIVIPGPASSGPPLTLTEDPQSARRFSLIMDRVTQQMESGAQGAAPDTQAVAQLLTLAAARSQTGGQLDSYLEQLRPLTGGKEGNIFVILGGAVPGWDPTMIPAGQNVPPPAQVGAMEKIIDLAPDSANAMKRFRELVSAAVEKFNDGAMAATVWMLDVANDSITEKKLDIAAVDHTRAEAVEAINAAQLRKYAENKGRHAALRLVLGFFPTLSLDELFRRLRGEPKADKRRSLIGFVEAWGANGRDAALDELERELGRADVDTYYLRNLIYLLHRVLRTSDDSVERELALLTRASERGQNIYVIKEAATAIGQIGLEASVKLLTLRLAEFEAMLLRNDTGDYPPAEVQKLLDRIISGLARIGSPAALLTIARHGMKANALLGDTRARLAALSQHDLSFDAATTSVLVKALRDEIPGKLLGRLLPKKQESQICLIEALSGTHTDETEELFHEIAQRFADADIGAAAAKVLEKWSPQPQRARPDAGATLTGELEFFGLPAVMQSLADMRATGMLTLRAKDGAAAAKLVVVDGKFLNAQRAHIRGADAMFEMLERPIAGTFAFVPHPPDAMKSDIAPREIIGMVLEGVRRHDELQRMAAFVPDDLRAAKGNAKPAPLEEETDAALVREVWLKASSGTPVAECEHALPADSYRVRRLIAHWIEQGALVTL
ncbi:MAG TPA: DUF4388 domain-containing protein [Thermoanaerobaculia bacterium]|nr:DUF4388 domain-containing protein [Thermoanaerobaculia bacterium]